MKLYFLLFTLFFLSLTSTLQSQSWDQLIKICASDRAANASFGTSVSIDGDYAIVGVQGEDSGGNDAGAAYIFKKNAGTWTQIKKIVASDPTAADNFGRSVSISGDYAIVGAPSNQFDPGGNNPLSNAGSAYIFYKDQGGVDNWGQIQKIVALDRAQGDSFGSSVSISGNYLIVGAYAESHDEAGSNFLHAAGSAYIFYKTGVTTWDSGIKIVASDRVADAYFGNSVSIYGDYAIVGAPYEDKDAAGLNSVSRAGGAYIFYRTGTNSWTSRYKIVATDRESDDNFGISVSISGNYAIVGAPGEDPSAIQNAGSAYIFYRTATNTWDSGTKIVAPDAGGSDLFGQAVAISGNFAAIGVSYEDENLLGGNTLNNAGSAYIFKRTGTTTWDSGTKAITTDRASNDWFGYSVSISGSNVILTAPYDSEDALGANTLSSSGSAYIFGGSPLVSTVSISNITSSTASSGGNVSDEGSAAVIARGVCLNTGGNPTTADSKTTDGIGTGVFSSNITGLQPNTTYYVRAYATNSVGTSYGDQISFTTLALSVSITNVLKVSDTQYTFTSDINNPGAVAVLDKGIVWSTSQNPTTTSNSGSLSSGAGSVQFTEDATGLIIGPGYYVRAYITTPNGTFYSEQVHFGVVPTLPEWGLIILAGGFLVTGGWLMFRKFM